MPSSSPPSSRSGRERQRSGARITGARPSVLVIDNYDSFTYNLVQYLGELGAEVEVVRNDKATVEELRELRPDRLVVSPGPAPRRRRASRSRRSAPSPRPAPRSSGSASATSRWSRRSAARIVRGDPIHGKDAEVEHDGKAIYEGLSNPLVAGRYHSLIADPDLPDELEVTSTYGDVVMGVRHRELPAEGVQFHPESVLTPQGKRLLANFLGA